MAKSGGGGGGCVYLDIFTYTLWLEPFFGGAFKILKFKIWGGGG